MNEMNEMNENEELKCLREKQDGQWVCLHDHTSCVWNDGHNGCFHTGNSIEPLEE
jgi:hypothetical protein